MRGPFPSANPSPGVVSVSFSLGIGGPAGQMLFKTLFGIDALTAAVVLYFFFIGLADGSVSSFNMGLWTAILAGLAAVLGGGYALRAAGWTRLANLVLLVLAVPALLYALFILLVVTTNPRWN